MFPTSLSEHFTLEEMTRSDYAASHNLSNHPNQEQLYRLKFLCLNCLEKLREAWGAPIVVTSGFRSPEVNKGVGGTNKSQHLRGMAADIRPVYSKDFAKLYRLANECCDFDQLLFEYNKSDGRVRCIHISTYPDVRKNRHQSSDHYLI